MKRTIAFLVAVVFPAVCPALNIVWVSDQLPIGNANSDHDGGAAGVFGPGPGPYADEGVISLLTGAGHSVTRFNPANATPLNAADITSLNASDLLIIARSIGSAAFDTTAETLPWNTLITKPMLVTNTYISRFSRLGFFSSGPNQPDAVSNFLTFNNPADPVSAYIIDGVSLSGGTTNNSVTEAITYADFAVDIRGISLITDPVVPGATVIASASGGAATFIASWPFGTPLAGISAGQNLSGYRMQFLVGNRESATAPNNTVGSAGFENLTPDGEGMFLRAVLVAANNGNVPVPEPSVAGMMILPGLAFLRRRRR